MVGVVQALLKLLVSRKPGKHHEKEGERNGKVRLPLQPPPLAERPGVGRSEHSMHVWGLLASGKAGRYWDGRGWGTDPGGVWGTGGPMTMRRSPVTGHLGFCLSMVGDSGIVRAFNREVGCTTVDARGGTWSEALARPDTQTAEGGGSGVG